jgi:hypothetical protein
VVTKDVTLYTSTSIPHSKLYEPEVEIFPNPFSEQLTISVNVKFPTIVDIDVINLAGQKVGTVSSSFLVDNQQSFIWDVTSRSLSKGIYFIRVKTHEAMVSKKVSLL